MQADLLPIIYLFVKGAPDIARHKEDRLEGVVAASRG
jgi:hypothetical protein